MKSLNRLKRKSAQAKKSKKFDGFVWSSEGSTSGSDCKIIEEEIFIKEEEGNESEKETECRDSKESYLTGEFWIQCTKCQKWYHAMRKRTMK